MVYGYARAAANDTGSNNSIKNQINIMKNAGAEKIYSEIGSGLNSDRPVLNEMLQKLKSGDELIVTGIDRLTRNAQYFMDISEDLKKRKIAITSLN